MGLLQTRIDWDKLNDNAYNGGKRLIRDLGNAAKGIACQLYRDTPGALIPNPASNLLDGMWDGICSDDPSGLPPPPAPPFTGGQCQAKYRVYVSIQGKVFRQDGSVNGTPSSAVDEKVFGEIKGFRVTDLNTLPSGSNEVYLQCQCRGLAPSSSSQPSSDLIWVDFYRLATSSDLTPSIESYVITNIVRLDGQPDDCGNPPPEYPPPPPTYTPPSGDITINPGLTLPFVWIDADFNLDIKPYIDVGGIKITFDVGGINFEFNSDNPPPTYNPDINPLPDTTFPPTIIPPFPTIPDYTDNFNDLIDLNNNNKVDLTNVINNVGNDIKTDIQTETNEIDADLQAILDLLNNLTNNPPPPPPPSTVEITYDRGLCGENGWVAKESTLIVPEDLADSVRETLNEIDATKRLVCQKDIGEIVGIPLNHYDGTTSACVVLYFAVTIPGAKGIGRYLQIPNPDIEAIVSACTNFPPYQTGDFMAYVQFNSSKGEKIQVNGITPEYATGMKDLLRSLSLYTAEDVYYDAPPRRTPNKYKRSLELRRATYFFNRKSRYDGSDRGRIIWRKSYAN